LGCGAHVAHLRRSAVGNYPTEKMVTIKTLETLLARAVAEDVPPSVYLDDLLLPMTTACDGIPAVFVDDMSANFLRHGNPVQCSNAPANGLVQVFIGDDVDTGEFIGVGEIDDDGLVNPKRITVVG
jgi:tRNA pseudouridine55 synthase